MHLDNPRNQLRIDLLTAPCPQLKALTFARYQSFLDDPTSAPDQAFAVAAWLGDLPVALALVSEPSADGVRTLRSLQTSPLFRRCGMATQLMAALESLAAARGTQKLVSQHAQRLAGAAAFRAWLISAGWTEPVEIEYRLAAHANSIEQAAKSESTLAPLLSWLKKRGFSATPWSNINDADRHAIRQLMAQHFTDKERITGFDPFPYEADDTFVLPITLVLRQHGQVVGWILGSKEVALGPQVFSYPRAFVLPALRPAGWLVGGIHAVCRRQAEAFGPQSLCIFEVAASNTQMHRFVEQRIKPYAIWTDIRYQSSKSL